MKGLCIFLLALFLSSLTAHAQSNPKKPVKECSAPLAKQLVEQQAIESRSVEETDKRIRILLRVADFLWLGDEETARKYFAEAFQIAQLRLKNKEEDKTPVKGLSFYQADYRFDVISAIAKRDADWAKKLAEAVMKEFDEDKETDQRKDLGKDSEIRSILGIAGRMAKDNPNLSLTLARRAMRYPLNQSWYFTLYQMAFHNQTLADQIYGELLANYPNAEAFRLLYLSAYPFGRDRTFGLEKYTMGTSVPAGFTPNQNYQRQFLLVFLRRVMQMTPENTTQSSQGTPETVSAVMALKDIEPLIQPQFPDLAQTFAQAKIHADSIASADAMQKAKDREEADQKFNNPFDVQLEELEKADGEGKLTDSQIFRLVNSARTEEQYKKAESWIDKTAEETTREALRNFFYFQRAKLAVKDKRLDEARKHALKVPVIEHRAVLFFDIAEAKLKEPLTKLESLETLLEVYQAALKSPDTVEKAQVLLGTAFMYEKIDHYNALNALADAIKIANKLESPNLFDSMITQMVKGKNFTHYSSYSVPGFDVTETFYEISKKDFQGALNNSTSFSDKYARTLAVLATVKDCEKSEPPVKQKAKTK